MTEQEIRMARHIKDEILPKLHEIQRDVYLDEHICMDIVTSTYKKNIHVRIYVMPDIDADFEEKLCHRYFDFTTYLLNEEEQRARNMEQLRDIANFVKDWQRRLG